MKPLLLKHEKKIKELIAMTQSAATEGVNQAAKAAADPTNMVSAMQAAAKVQSKIAEVADDKPVVANNIN